MKCAVFIHIILIIYSLETGFDIVTVYVCAQYACLVAWNTEDASSPLRLELDRFE